jgi:hypothetical protein
MLRLYVVCAASVQRDTDCCEPPRSGVGFPFGSVAGLGPRLEKVVTESALKKEDRVGFACLMTERMVWTRLDIGFAPTMCGYDGHAFPLRLCRETADVAPPARSALSSECRVAAED